jgi:RHS repeat-associated protein
MGHPRRRENEKLGHPPNNGQVSYTFDNVGNRLQRNSTLPAVPATGLLNYDANDRTAADPYDSDGNLLSSGAGTNVYDFENRLVQAGGVSIVYDGDGNRVVETVAGVTTHYLVAELNPTGYAQVIEEHAGIGNLQRQYAWGLQLISARDFPSGTSHYYGLDGHGSVRFLTSSTGAITDTYDYDAFGNLISKTGTTTNNYLFAGEQFDPALGIYYNRARYYDQRLGRFWTMDDAEGENRDPISLHTYLYASANPIDRLDPSGNESLVDISVSFAIDQTLNAMPISAVFRAGQFAVNVLRGQDLGDAAKGAALGFLEDTAFTFLSAGLLRYAAGVLPLRQAGTALVRAANSAWNKVGIGQRGRAVEDFIFANVFGRLRSLHPNFPVIDDFYQGIATSIKSIDLTAASYQSASALRSVLSRYAGNLAEFGRKNIRQANGRWGPYHWARANCCDRGWRGNGGAGVGAEGVLTEL